MADLQQTVYPHKWSPVSCRSSAAQGSWQVKDRRSTTAPRNNRDSPSNYYSVLNQMLKVFSGTCQQFVEDAVNNQNQSLFLDFRLLQSSVATYCRWCGNFCAVYIWNFLINQRNNFENGFAFAKVINKHQFAYTVYLHLSTVSVYVRHYCQTN